MPETIGQRLKREREARYISLEKAAEETRIRRAFLQALEADDFSVMPSAAQGRGFLRNYAEYLGVDIDELIAEIQRNPIPPAEVSGPLPQINLSETELPPLVDSKEDEPALRFRMLRPVSALVRLLRRKPERNLRRRRFKNQPKNPRVSRQRRPQPMERDKPKSGMKRSKTFGNESLPGSGSNSIRKNLPRRLWFKRREPKDKRLNPGCRIDPLMRSWRKLGRNCANGAR